MSLVGNTQINSVPHATLLKLTLSVYGMERLEKKVQGCPKIWHKGPVRLSWEDKIVIIRQSPDRHRHRLSRQFNLESGLRGFFLTA